MLRPCSGIAGAILLVGVLASEAAATGTATILAAPGDTPSCTTPQRLMDFVRRTNDRLDPRFDALAELYRGHGINMGIRWDWAFFQMLVETGYLTFATPDGKPGNVRPHQNNFAGLASTGPGVPGESFPTPEDGVRAHLQHLLAYSGRYVAHPLSRRTAAHQGWIVPWAQGLGHPVTFAEMTRIWSPHDPGYADDLAGVADRFDAYCRCASYAEDSLAQVRAGQAAGCELTGTLWVDDFETHFRWCATTAMPQELAADLAARQALLNACATSDPCTGAPDVETRHLCECLNRLLPEAGPWTAETAAGVHPDFRRSVLQACP